jgi:hypothetical protein
MVMEVRRGRGDGGVRTIAAAATPGGDCRDRGEQDEEEATHQGCSHPSVTVQA